MRLIATFVICLASLTPGVIHALEDSREAAFTAQADQAYHGAHEMFPLLPGFTVAVVVGDRTVYARGFGSADLERTIPAGPDVVYYIASATKSFTALAAAILDHRGDLDLDAPLTTYLGEDALDPALEPEQITGLDLLRHTSGLQNPMVVTRLAYTGQHTPDLLWDLIPHTAANDAGRGNYQYTNFGYNLLGMILERETGSRWQDLLFHELFDPLGLHRTTAYASQADREGWSRARPYSSIHPDAPRRLYLEKVDATMQSAGGMLSSAHDLARWVSFQINLGRLNGTQLVPEAVVERTHALQVEHEDRRRRFTQVGYGLGWLHGRHHGRLVLSHAGSFVGAWALVSFMPQERVGVVVLINETGFGAQLAESLAAFAYDWWNDEEDPAGTLQTVTEALAPRLESVRARVARDLEERAQREWNLSLSDHAYTGTFSNDLHGTMRVGWEENGFRVEAGVLRCVATPYPDPDTMRIELVPGSGDVLRYRVENGAAVAVEIGGDRYHRVE